MISNWIVFLKMFQIGEQVVIIDEDDVLWWGKITDMNYEVGLTLTRPCGIVREIFWEDMKFIAQDGFPIQKLKGADGSSSILKEPSMEEFIRHEEKKKKEKDIENSKKHQHSYHVTTTYISGDPWVIKADESVLINSGNFGDIYYENDIEECLLLTNKNGAKAQLYNLPMIFNYELAI